MRLKVQKRIAANILKCSPKRVAFNPERLEEIKEAITKSDIKGLAGKGLIKEKPKAGISRVRTNHNLKQRAKGRQKGHGNRKGRKTARSPAKETWMTKVTVQRNLIKKLKYKN